MIETERDDIDARGVLRFVAIIVAVTVLGMFAMKLMFDGLLAGEQAGDLPPSLLAERNQTREPPAPRLQTAPEVELGAMRAEEEEQLQHYLWLDRERGRVQIPIGRAMDLVVERGLPVHREGEPHAP